MKPINITFPKYIENIQLGTNEGYHLFSLSRVSVEDVFGMYNKNFTINYTLSKLNDSSYTLSTDYAYQIMNTPAKQAREYMNCNSLIIVLTKDIQTIRFK